MRLYYVLSFFILLSCQSRIGLTVFVHNETFTPIDSLIIATSDFGSMISFNDLKPKSYAEQFLDMEDIIKTDGSYFVKLINGTRQSEDHFGYYTNGFPLEKRIDVFIENDTIIYKTIRKNY